MENSVEEYLLFHPDRGIEKQCCHKTKNRDPLDYIHKIEEDVAAFRFYNEKDGYSTMYLVGKRISPQEVSDIALSAFGIDRNCTSVIAMKNGCYFTPDSIPDNITIDEYRESLDINTQKNIIKEKKREMNKFEECQFKIMECLKTMNECANLMQECTDLIVVGVKLKHCVGEHCFDEPVTPLGYGIRDCEVEEKDPLKINPYCNWFHFYDEMHLILPDGNTVFYKKTNISPRYFRGKRLSQEKIEAKKRYYPKYKKVTQMIYVEDFGMITDISGLNDRNMHNVFINPEDMTIDEYKESLKCEKNNETTENSIENELILAKKNNTNNIW